MPDKKRINLDAQSSSDENEPRAFPHAKIPGEILSRIAFWAYKGQGE